MKLTSRCLGLAALMWLLPLARADDPPKASDEVKKIVQSLEYQHGVIHLPGGMARLNLPANISYLDPNNAAIVLVKLWGNPPSARKTLGMLFPTGKSPVEPDCWAVTITATADGHVKDDDAGSINYGELLKQMQRGTLAENKERTARGYPAMDLSGWAEPPHYDATTHKLYWAREFRVEGVSENTLNYDIRILGRRGVLVLSAVAGMNQLPEIRKQAPAILGMVEFNPGDRYTDFDPKADKVANYGVAALVAGGMVAKLGTFRLFWIGLLSVIIFIMIGAVAVWALVRKLLFK